MTSPSHRRGAAVRQAVLGAAAELLATEGLPGIRVADVAVRAGVHETSIYRRWSTRDKLILDAVLHRLDADVPVPDTGSTREDLIDLLTALAAFLVTPTGRAMSRLALDDAAQLGEARNEFWTARIALVAVVVHRGIDRGDIPPDVDPEFLLEVLGGALHLRILQRALPTDRNYVSRLVDLLLAGVHSVPPAKSSH